MCSTFPLRGTSVSRLLVHALLLGVLIEPSIAEVVIGGTASVSGTLELTRDERTQDEEEAGDGNAVFTAEIGFDPNLYAVVGAFEFSADAGVFYRLGERLPALRVNRLLVTAYPGDAAIIKGGRFRYVTGTAQFLPILDVHGARDYGALVSGGQGESRLDADLLQAAFFAGDLFWRITVEPLPVRPLLPAADSRWFPTKDLPVSITYSFPFDHTIYLAGVTLEESDAPIFTLQDFSFSTELGGAFGPMDITFLYYHGLDRDPVFRSELDLSEGIFEDFSVIIRPVSTHVDQFGLSFLTGFGDFRLWGDLGYSINKAFASELLSTTTFETGIERRDYLEWAVGGSYELYFNSIGFTLAVEYAGGHCIRGDEYLNRPLLAHALSGLWSLSFADGKAAVTGTYILSLSDFSHIQVYGLSFTPVNELEISLSAPFFLGGDRTELGQYRGRYSVSFGAEFRF
jgi:hypothetical protein